MSQKSRTVVKEYVGDSWRAIKYSTNAVQLFHDSTYGGVHIATFAHMDSTVGGEDLLQKLISSTVALYSSPQTFLPERKRSTAFCVPLNNDLDDLEILEEIYSLDIDERDKALMAFSMLSLRIVPHEIDSRSLVPEFAKLPSVSEYPIGSIPWPQITSWLLPEQSPAKYYPNHCIQSFRGQESYLKYKAHYETIAAGGWPSPVANAFSENGPTTLSNMAQRGRTELVARLFVHPSLANHSPLVLEEMKKRVEEARYPLNYEDGLTSNDKISVLGDLFTREELLENQSPTFTQDRSAFKDLAKRLNARHVAKLVEILLYFGVNEGLELIGYLAHQSPLLENSFSYNAEKYPFRDPMFLTKLEGLFTEDMKQVPVEWRLPLVGLS